MNVSTANAVEVRNAFDIVEEAYEFMLAYAAQGRKHEVAEGEPGGESQIRNYLNRFVAALDALRPVVVQDFAEPEGAAYAARFVADLDVVRSVLALVLGRPSISSDMIDNTAGMIAMRSFLTNVFFVDQVVLPPR